MTLPAMVPVLSTTPGATLWAGPALGEHTDQVRHQSSATVKVTVTVRLLDFATSRE